MRTLVMQIDTQMLLTYETSGNLSGRYLHTLKRHVFTGKKGPKGALDNQVIFVVPGSAIANPGINVT